MQIFYEKSFKRDLSHISDKAVKSKLSDIICELKNVSQFPDSLSLKKMVGYSNFYRIRIGNFRVGIKYDNNAITFIRILKRADIYKYFP